jgi:hypothetical protein
VNRSNASHVVSALDASPVVAALHAARHRRLHPCRFRSSHRSRGGPSGRSSSSSGVKARPHADGTLRTGGAGSFGQSHARTRSRNARTAGSMTQQTYKQAIPASTPRRALNRATRSACRRNRPAAGRASAPVREPDDQCTLCEAVAYAPVGTAARFTRCARFISSSAHASTSARCARVRMAPLACGSDASASRIASMRATVRARCSNAARTAASVSSHV